ncbi:prolactin-releasing peptide receptor [Brachionus plicatilis]|uniref:Prolactin-releasing peptide receptor n=1 Tax=Brachionus plicatilis TaxID=10195 RepID=A0A3M7RKY5_BRAPC|nr:prolactin-releasing peptide receptor [Brachionus plicatilis]
MCFMMVLTFMIFWAPLHFLNLYRFLDDSINYAEHISDIFFVCHLIAVSRSFVNPFIYAWINPKFRHGLKYFMLCYCFSETEKKKLKYSNRKYVMTNLHYCADSFHYNKRQSIASSATRSNQNSCHRKGGSQKRQIDLNSKNSIFESNQALGNQILILFFISLFILKI